MTNYVTVQKYCEEYGYAETSALGQYRDLAKVSAELLRATVEGADVSSWSADQQSSANTMVFRIGGLITGAEQKVDASLRSAGMQVPLVTADELIQSIVMRLARYALHREHPGEIIRQHYDDAQSELMSISEGKLLLDPDADGTSGSTGVSVEVAVGQDRSDTDRAFSRHTLQRYVRR